MELTRESVWSPLSFQGFRRLLLGQVLSDFANWLDFIALSTLIVYTWGYGSMALAALSICMGLPWVIIGPLLSTKIGRWKAKKVLVVCNILRAGIVFGMIWAPSLPMILFLVLLKMSVSAVFDPVRQGAVKGLVETRFLAQASSMSQMSVNLTKILSPLLGGFLIGWLGKASPFMIGTVLYAISALLLSGLPTWKGQNATDPDQKHSILQAWDMISSHPLLKHGILYSALNFFLVFLYDGLFVLLAKSAGLNESQFGILIGSVGIGSVVGALCAGQWKSWRKRPLNRMTSSGMVSGFLLALIGISAFGRLPQSLVFWILICFSLGICSAQAAVPLGYLLQSETTLDTVGPISALSNALQTCSMLIAPLLGGISVQWLKLGGVYLTVGLLMLILAVIYRKSFARFS